MPSITSAKAFGRWFSEGLSIAIPSPLKNIGWRPQKTRINLNADGNYNQKTIEQSWLGQERPGQSASTTALPVEIVLPPEQVFVTRLSLPVEALRTLKSTIALRLDEISPIPPETAAFAVGQTHRQTEKNKSGARYSVDVAIIRKTILNNVRDKFSDHQIFAIGAHTNANGALRFIFDDDIAQQKNVNQPLLSAGLIFVSILSLLIGAATHLERRLNALNQHEANILSEIRSLRPVNAMFQNIELHTLKTNQGAPTQQALQQTQRYIEELPGEMVAKTINIRPTRIDITGYAPGTILSDNIQSTRPSNYEGFVEVIYVKSLEASNE